MVDVEYCNRIVFLGVGGVGKIFILKRFFNGEYFDIYEEMVEDFYLVEYDVRDIYLLVDFLDIVGNIVFLVMCRFLIVNV